MKPLLCLVMIVKDEVAGIRATLESAKPWIDRWLILDTGSTDGTQAIVREVMRKVPGRLVEEPFAGFGPSRSRALELADEECVFTLMLSGNEVLRDGVLLRKHCEENARLTEPAHEVYLCSVIYGIPEGQSSHRSWRLVRTGCGWRYLGATHEWLEKVNGPKPHPVTLLDGPTIYHDRSGDTAEKRRATWERDKLLLLGELARDPMDARSTFYLAQSYYCLGEWEMARHFYERRAQMEPGEEVFESRLRVARCAKFLGRPWPEVESLYLAAHAERLRAEPLYEIAEHWRDEHNWPLAYLFVRRACELHFPTGDLLFVSDDVYNYLRWELLGVACWYLGDYGLGEIALRHALKARPGEKHLLENLETYERRKAA